MAYQFQRAPVASVKLSHFRGDSTDTLTLSNINGSLSNADSLIAGVSQFLSIVGLGDQVVPSRLTRVVTEYVVND